MKNRITGYQLQRNASAGEQCFTVSKRKQGFRALTGSLLDGKAQMTLYLIQTTHPLHVHDTK